MAQVQTTYDIFHDQLTQGQVATTTTRDVDSGILNGTANVAFGAVVRRDPAGDAVDCIPGVARRRIALADGGINSSATTLVVSDAVGTELAAGQHLVVGTEVLYVSAVAATSLTIVRGALNSTPAAIADDAEVCAFEDPLFWGITCLDQRLPASNEAVYTAGDPVSVLVRGDVAVPVSAAVTAGSAVVVSLAAATGDAQFSLSARPPDATHVALPGAQFVTDAADNGLAVVRLAP